MQQSGTTRLQNVVYNKLKLFLLTFILVISVLAIPVIIPHITHPSMIYHIFLHISSLIIAIFLSTVSILAYKRNVTLRLLFMSFGFLSLAIVELFYLLYATINIEDIIIPIVHIELPHIILFAMLALFGMGVFKVNNKL